MCDIVYICLLNILIVFTYLNQKYLLYCSFTVLLAWGIAYVELGEAVTVNGELFGMTILVVAAYLVGWLWLKITTLPALIAMLLTGIVFQNLNFVHMTNDYRKLNQDLRFVSIEIV